MHVNFIIAGMEHPGAILWVIFPHQVGKLAVHGVLAAHQVHKPCHVIGIPEGILPQGALVQPLPAPNGFRVPAFPRAVCIFAPQKAHRGRTYRLLTHPYHILVLGSWDDCILPVQFLIQECPCGVLLVILHVFPIPGLVIQHLSQLGDCPVVITVFHHTVCPAAPVCIRNLI